MSKVWSVIQSLFKPKSNHKPSKKLVENPDGAKIIALNINNQLTGDYVGRIYVGSEKVPCDVILDTGSSTLAINGKKYSAQSDSNAKDTGLIQAVQYGSGSWQGNVISTNVNLNTTNDQTNLNPVNLAVTYKVENMFRNSDGILGLAYQQLNGDIYRKEGENYVRTNQTIQPYFTQLEEAGISANKFSFYTLRSTPSQRNSSLNEGFLIFGGGEEQTNLYTGDFQTAKVTHDQYYNVNLKSIQVGDQSPISVAPPSGNGMPNCIVDSGTNGLVFPKGSYQQVLSQFGALEEIISTALGNQNQYPQRKLNLSDWPAIHVTLEGLNGDITLSMQPDTYWQLDAGRGNASLRFFGASEPAILGLPLMNNYYCIFDRSAADGVGTIKFADIKA